MRKLLSLMYLVFLNSAYVSAQNAPEMSLKQKQTCNQLIPFWEKFTEMPESKYALLYHVMNLFDPNYSLKTEENIRNYGLLSANELIHRGFGSTRKKISIMRDQLDQNNDEHLPYEFDVIYFMPQAFFYGTELNKHAAPSRVVRYLVRSNDYDLYDGLQRGGEDVVTKYEATKQPLATYNYDNGKAKWDYFPETFRYGSIPPEKLIFYYPVTNEDKEWAQEQEKQAKRESEEAYAQFKEQSDLSE